MEKQTYFFCGVGGLGMSALAQIMLERGVNVAGSDRAYDMGLEREKFRTLQNIGAKLYPQDGSGIKASGADVFVASSAVEDTIPDVKAAKEAGCRIVHRSELLAELAHSGTLMTVGGTSGKSTTTGMLAHIMTEAGTSPTIINGASVVGQKNAGLSNAAAGTSDITVIEVDESDASISRFTPQIAVLNNVSKDHKTMVELRQLFKDYLARAEKGVVVNLDCPEVGALLPAGKPLLTFSLKDPKADFYATKITPTAKGITFTLNGEREVHLKVYGWYNVANALAAIAAATMAGITTEQAAQALESFGGMKRRLERVGTENGISVIDDFAHNPHKIAASLKALKEYPGRVFAIYQPHGFGPTKMMRDELIATFRLNLGPEDCLIMPDIYFVGGTADKSISSADIIHELADGGVNATYTPNREDIYPAIARQLKPGDRICVMGARDGTLADFARSLLKDIRKKSA